MLVSAYTRWLEFKASREHSVKVVGRRNDRDAFETIFGSDELLSEYLGAARMAFYDEVAEVCAKFEPSALIDIGCGPGHLLAAIEQRSPSLRCVVGVDYAQAALDRLHLVVPRATRVLASVYDIDLEGQSFDLVVCTEVLEHLARPEEAVRVLGRLCRPGGHLVVTVPDGERDDYEGHVNFWNEEQLRELLSPVGRTSTSRTRDGDLLAVVDV